MEPSEELEHLRLAIDLSGLDVPEVFLPEEHHLVVAGLRLHYLDWGKENRPPILFLHGGALNAHTWDMVCLAMRGDYRCLALDQRGHGDSEWSPEMDYAPEAHRRDIAGFADSLGLDRFLIVGQSMGGLNAFVYATAHANRLAGLVVIDTGPNIRVEGAQRIGAFVGQTAESDSLEALVDQAMSFNPLRDRRLLRRSLLHNLRRLPNGKWARKHDMRHWGQFSNAQDIARHTEERWKDAANVTCPTLVVRGEKSDVFDDAAAAAFARMLPKARWLGVKGAGHTVQGDNPRGLCEALREFTAEIGW